MYPECSIQAYVYRFKLSELASEPKAIFILKWFGCLELIDVLNIKFN